MVKQSIACQAANDCVESGNDGGQERGLGRIEVPGFFRGRAGTNFVNRRPARPRIDFVNLPCATFNEGPDCGPAGTIIRALQGLGLQHGHGHKCGCDQNQQSFHERTRHNRRGSRGEGCGHKQVHRRPAVMKLRGRAGPMHLGIISPEVCGRYSKAA